MNCEEDRPVAFLVQGLFEISDSIGFDCVYQFRELTRAFKDLKSSCSVRLFAERFVSGNYPDVAIESIFSFYKWAEENPNGLVIYHYCGEWKDLDEYLIRREAPSIIRWHNNTPPWFYMDSGVSNAIHTLSGFDNIVDLINCKNMYFWVNSEFTRRQFLALGGHVERVSTVFPASRYLYKSFQAEGRRAEVSNSELGVDLLFVGRVVQHKGYKGLILVAHRLAEMVGLPVRLHLPGRIDVAMRTELTDFALKRGVDARLYGEVGEEELAHLYSVADVFLCLSEHEGFGLPVFEAMACNIPVVAWANTAFSDLLSGHPFGFKEYDINAFVAAIIALGDDVVRARVLEVQSEILVKYDQQVVAEQLRDGLKVLSEARSFELITAALPPELRAERVLSSEIASATVLSRKNPSTSVIRDSGSNLYSQYDLQIYREFLNKRSEERRTLLGPMAADPHIFFRPDEFSWAAGRYDGQYVHLGTGSKVSGHVIFGPYVQFPAGRYSAEFLLQFEGVKGVGLLADITAGGECVAEKTFLLQPASAAVGCELVFETGGDGSVVEFRIALKEQREGTMRFEGIRVRRK